MLFYKTLEAEIGALGALLHSSSRWKILRPPNPRQTNSRRPKEESDIVLGILSVLQDKNMDPIVLTAACRFARNVFECVEI